MNGHEPLRRAPFSTFQVLLGEFWKNVRGFSLTAINVSLSSKEHPMDHQDHGSSAVVGLFLRLLRILDICQRERSSRKRIRNSIIWKRMLTCCGNVDVCVRGSLKGLPYDDRAESKREGGCKHGPYPWRSDIAEKGAPRFLAPPEHRRFIFGLIQIFRDGPLPIVMSQSVGYSRRRSPPFFEFHNYWISQTRWPSAANLCVRKKKLCKPNRSSLMHSYTLFSRVEVVCTCGIGKISPLLTHAYSFGIAQKNSQLLNELAFLSKNGPLQKKKETTCAHPSSAHRLIFLHLRDA